MYVLKATVNSFTALVLNYLKIKKNLVGCRNYAVNIPRTIEFRVNNDTEIFHLSIAICLRVYCIQNKTLYIPWGRNNLNSKCNYAGLLALDL